MDCIFCKIANGEIPSATLFEDEDFRVILDLGPARRGHALILPKTHYQDLFDMPDEAAAKAVSVAKRVSLALLKGLKADGIQVMQNNGEAAGQTVFHFHMHLIPGYAGLGPGATWVPGELEEEDKEEILELVKQCL